MHNVFSTRERRPWLDANTRPRLHAYLATVCRNGDCQACRVGGAASHIRIAGEAVMKPDETGTRR